MPYTRWVKAKKEHIQYSQERISSFSEEEYALFALTDEITIISKTRVLDEIYIKAASHFFEHKIAAKIMLIDTINSWKGIANSIDTVFGRD